MHNEQIQTAIEGQNLDNYETAVDDIWIDATQTGQLSDEDLADLLTLMQQQFYLNDERAWYLLWAWQQMWSCLKPSQKTALLVVIEKIYFGFNNAKGFDAQFLITELLGEYFADDTALQAISRLRVSVVQDDQGRAIMAHALQHLLETRPDEPLRNRARRELQDMAQDTAEVVRQEAGNALKLIEGYA